MDDAAQLQARNVAIRARGLAVVVVGIHLGILGLHAAAHEALQIGLTAFQAAYVAGVIFVAPVVAVLLLFTRFWRGGAVLLLASMLASLVFGLVSHAVLPGEDNVFEVGAGGWALTFQLTGVALLVVEALGTGLGVSLMRSPEPLRPTVSVA